MATLASRFGWSYETLMTMSGAERRLWLAAAARLAPAAAAATPSAGSLSTAPEPASTAGPARPAFPMSSDAEARARLMELHEQLNHRGR